MEEFLNGVSTEQKLAEVIAFRNLAARLNESWRGKVLDDHHDMMMSIIVWFQELMVREPEAFWQRAFKHLQRTTQDETLRLWMDYPVHWEVPAALRGPGIDYSQVRFFGAWAFNPVRTTPRGPVALDEALDDYTTASEVAYKSEGGYARGRVRGKNGDEPIELEGWHRIYKRHQPSKAAVERAIRMCVLSRLCGRRLTTSKEMLIAEGQAWLKWALGTTALRREARDVMRALLLDDEFVILVHQLPMRQRA